MINTFLLVGPQRYFDTELRRFFARPNEYGDQFRVVIGREVWDGNGCFEKIDHYILGMVENMFWVTGEFEGGNDFCTGLTKEQADYLQFYLAMERGKVGEEFSAATVRETLKLIQPTYELVQSGEILPEYEEEYDDGWGYDIKLKFEIEDDEECMFFDSYDYDDLCNRHFARKKSYLYSNIRQFNCIA